MDSTLNSPTLSDMLRDARVAKGLELNDIAEITHVRKDYLQALEEGRYGDLPEDIYARNFLRLYAQAVGLDDAKLLERFSRERRSALGISVVPETVANAVREVTPKRGNPARVWLPVLLLAVAVGGIGYFAFNRFLFPTNASNALQPQTASGNEASLTPETQDATTQTPASETSQTVEQPATTDVATPAPESTAPTPDATTPETAPVPAGATTTPPEGTASVPFSLVTNPPGAEATLDNYPFPYRTPFFDAPVTPRAARVLRITLEGYEPYEELIDITQGMERAVTLTPVGAAPTIVPGTTVETATTPAQGQATGQGQIGITVEAETWLEVYQSTVRGEGQRLVYSTVSPGQTFSFNLPVFVHVGNAAGVRLSQDNQDLGLMGSSGEVTGRAFGQPLPPAPTPAPTPATPAPTTPAEEGPQ